ncbi:MAG: glycine C-acetyltransferase [Gammaproteobacteria bacterium]|nr:glycine C-acetyltransferase [Gammaproteobacteria bacterium]MBK85198.1 glycine C-acetyltransferase [Gammaproteobacteria bacterium]|tara:strand:- start:7 stop:1203 length:1197 start_codon:yes stop_codon:yes gene_type:complete
MKQRFLDQISEQLTQTEKDGLYKKERLIFDQQKAEIEIAEGQKVLNFCANNYLGLANHPDLVDAAKQGLDTHGFGMASVRFICGTQDIHKTLERQISHFLGMEDTILYPSCFDANGGLFETLLGPEDAVVSDALNHASIIDGIRLCKAKRYRYANNDMQALEEQLQLAKADGARHIMIATDGVFSMDGIIADLEGICDLADKYGAMVMVDDCHATGFVGEQGRGSQEHCNVLGRIDIITGTLGKALGGASGGFVASKKPIVDWLRQRSRPYLFSNSVAPAIVAASIKAFDLLQKSDDLRAQLNRNSEHFRARMTEAGFTLAGKDHAIIPVMLGDAQLASTMADKLLEKGVYVIGFSFPVVPKGQARIRTQMSAAHSIEDIDRTVDAFIAVGKELGVVA